MQHGYNSGSKYRQIVQCRLRLGCSDICIDKFKMFISANPNYSCGYHHEDHVTKPLRIRRSMYCTLKVMM